MKRKSPKEGSGTDYSGYRSMRTELMVVFSCLTAIPFGVFAFIYFGLETLNTSVAGGLIAMVLVLVLGGFVLFRRTTDHIENLSTALSVAEEGKPEGLHEAPETRELAIIADSFNRTLVKLEESARELGHRALQMATLNEIREIASRSIRLDQVAETILERVAGVMEAGAGYLAVKRDASPTLNIEASFGLRGSVSDTINPVTLNEADGHFFDSPTPLLVEDARQNDKPDALNIFSPSFPRCLYLPIVAKGTSIGLIALAREEVRKPFREEDAQFLQILIQQVAYSVENARLYQSLGLSNKKLKAAPESRKKAQERLITSARMAAFGDLALNIANELNNPLTGIMGYAELMTDGSPREQEKSEYLKEIRSQAVRASQITRGLLDFASTRPGPKIRTDLNDLLQKTLLLVKGRIVEHHLHLDLKLAKDLPPAMADPAQMGQVFFNLISNALNALTGAFKASSASDKDGLMVQGKRRLLRIESGTRDKNVYVSFKDTGTGIAPEDLSRIFEPFFSTQDKVSQVGLGLWVSDRIVKAHGGLIRVRSDPDRGSVFVVVLPLKEAGVKK